MDLDEIACDLRRIVGDEWVVTDERALQNYLYDETPSYMRPSVSTKVVLVKPGSTEEVAKIVRLANSKRVPIFPRGGGTGLVGGAIPTEPGILLSLERLDEVRIDEDSLIAEVGAGVTLSRLIEEAEKHGLFFPPHPGDEGAFVGGMIATNAGGARAVRTGVMRNYVLGVEVVLPDGSILKLGGKLIKNNMGYNVMQLIIGSEGTLGIITKAFIRLYPKQKYSATMIAPFNNRLSAVNAALRIMRSGVIPLLLEYVDRDAIQRSANYLGLKWPCEEGTSYLIITVSEAVEDAVYGELELINSVIEEQEGLEPVVTTRSDEQAEILKIRSEIYSSLKDELVDVLDVSLPLGMISKFMESFESIERKYNVRIPICGHVGDGNLHPHILRVNGWTRDRYERLRNEIYDLCINLGGSITGEHGIGAVRIKYLSRYLSDEHLRLLTELKRLFDPNNILNPGKVVPISDDERQ